MKRETIVLYDCLETIDETLDKLREVHHNIELYLNMKTLYTDDLKTLINAAITNQVTCLDGFSHDDVDKHILYPQNLPCSHSSEASFPSEILKANHQAWIDQFVGR
ncbi:hypothetical protein JHK82_023672 [Glycine max]|nr:hypothetical protein JHK82_023672 [Glycine max]